MNKIYKVIWSKAKNSYVVTSELAKSHTKSPNTNVFSSSFVAGVLACILVSGVVLPVYAEGNTGIGVNGVSDQSMNYEGGGALGYDAIAIGDAKSAGSASISIGAGTLVTGQNSIAIGTNAMASGDGATREIVDRLLRNNKDIREGLDVARSDYTASTNAYNLQLERFNKTNEAVARVEAANELIVGYQNEIDTTLQPNADTANATYNTAKADYDDLSNRLAQQLEVVKYIDFTQYQQPGSDVIDTNAVAADIKAQAEAGTDFDYPQEMYKAYVDSYIESEGNGRSLYVSSQVLSPSTSYQSNNTLETVNLEVHRAKLTAALQLAGLIDDDSKVAVFQNYPMYFTSSGQFNVNTGVLTGSPTNSVRFESYARYNRWEPAYLNGYNKYAKTVTLDDESFATTVSALNNTIDTQITAVTNNFLAEKNSGIFGATELANIDNNIAKVTEYENSRRQIYLDILNYSHESYLYEKYKNEEGETSVNALEHLSLKGSYKQKVMDALGESVATRLFTVGDNSIITYKNYDLEGPKDGYGNHDWYSRVTGIGSFFSHYSLIPSTLFGWYKENVSDHENLVRYTLNQLKGSMNDFLVDKRTAYEEATAAKTAADTALANKQAQLNAAQPTADDVAAANAAAATATALQQKADKLEADRVALEAAKAQLDNLQSIEESGQGAIAVGNNAITTGKDAVGIGSDSISTGEEAVALGKQNVVAAKQAIGLGSANSVSGEESLAIGHNNGVTGTQSLAVGTGHVVTGSHSGAIGDPNIVNGDNSYVVGNNSFVAESSTDMFVLGNNVNASGNNSVVLGTNSSGSQNNVVSVGHKATDLDINGQPYGTAMNRRIVNVANGVDNNDAVNVAQLNSALSNLGNGLKLAGIGVNGVGSQSMNHDGSGAIGYDSIAIGDAKSAGSASVSIGAGALVTGQNSIAIGTNSMASGDGMTRQQVDTMLSNNRAIREGLDTARSTYTASQNEYNLSLERFNKTNEAVARVNAANQVIAGYQAEIDTTLQPNADTANAAYNTAKADYDDLSNRLAQQLEVVKYIDFTQYQQEGSDTIDTNAVAAEIKAQAEAGTDFNYPQEMYKAYVDSYIESEGNGRETFLLAKNIKPQVAYEQNNTVQYYRVSTGNDARYIGVDNGVSDNFFRAVGWESPDVEGNVFTHMSFGGSFRVKDDTGEMYDVRTDLANARFGGMEDYSVSCGASIYTLELPESNGSGYYQYCKTVTLSDEDYNTKMAALETALTNHFTSLDKIYSGMRNSGVLNEQEKLQLDEGLQWCKDYELGRVNLVKQILGYSHEKYLYEKYKNEEGETSVNALTHLSKQGEYKEAVTNIIGETQAEQLFTPAVSNTITYNGVRMDSVVLYGGMNKSIYKWAYTINERIINWYKDNVIDHQNLVKYTLNKLKGSMNDFLADKRTAYDEATAAKTAADNALNAKQQQIAQATPSQADINAANAAQASATELQQKADKLDVDRTALENAKASLDELQTIEEAGQGAIAVGNNAITTGQDAVGIGSDTITTGLKAVAVGKENIASGDESIAIGNANSVSDSKSIAIGAGNGITGEESIALGTGNIVRGSHSGAFGDPNIVDGDNSYSVGNNNQIAADTTDVFLLGNSIKSTVSDVVALGSNSSAQQANTISVGHKSTDLDINGQAYGSNLYRKIINVADGFDDHDVATVGQLNTAISNVNVTPNGVVASGNTGIVSGGTVYTAIQSAKTELNSTIDSTKIPYVAIDNTNWPNWDEWRMQDYIKKVYGVSNKAEYLALQQNPPNLNGTGAHADKSIAIGYDAQAPASEAVNTGTLWYYHNIAIGTQSLAKGYAVAMGYRAKANSSSTVAIGNEAVASGGVAIGKHAIGNGDITIGDNAYSYNFSTSAIGDYSHVTAYKSNAWGYQSTVDDDGQNSVAIGTGSFANEKDVVSVGHDVGDYYYFYNDYNDTYTKSTYNDSLKRRIVNVADGINANDAATYGQLTSITSKFDVYREGSNVKFDNIYDKHSVKSLVDEGRSAYLASNLENLGIYYYNAQDKTGISYDLLTGYANNTLSQADRRTVENAIVTNVSDYLTGDATIGQIVAFNGMQALSNALNQIGYSGANSVETTGIEYDTLMAYMNGSLSDAEKANVENNSLLHNLNLYRSIDKSILDIVTPGGLSNLFAKLSAYGITPENSVERTGLSYDILQAYLNGTLTDEQKAFAEAAILTDKNTVVANSINVKHFGINAPSATTNMTGEGAVGENAIALGPDTLVSGNNSIATGTGNLLEGESSAIFGNNSKISNTSSDMFIFGNSVNAVGSNSVVLGSQSDGSLDNVVSVGHKATDLDINGQSYGTDMFRRIINVADGIDEHDVATVGQLNSVVTDSVKNYTAGTGLQLSNSYEMSVKNVLMYDSDMNDKATLGGANGTTLSNVKGGAINQASMDAINGSQLFAVKQDISGFASAIGQHDETIRALNTSVTSALSSVAASGLLVDTMDANKADASLNNLTEGGKRILRQYASDAVQEYMAAQQGANSAPMAPMATGSNTLHVTDAGNGSLHVGEGSSVTGSSSIAIGVGNQVNANNSGAFGDPSIINADDSYVLGNDDTVNAGATGSFIVGNNGESSAQGALLFGSNTKASFDAVDGVSIGNRSKVSAQNSIALGSDSIADTEGVLSIGNTTLKRKIVHVADGDVSSGSDEVVTGNQLFAVNEKVDKNVSDILKKADISYVDEGLSLKADKTSVYTKEQTDEQLVTKANVDASNINSSDWATKLGTGKVLPGDNNLVTGDTVFGALYQYDASNNLVRSVDGVISIGKADTGRIIDVTNASGETRVITGVATNPQDESSAANVGYVNSVGTSLMEKMNTGLSRIESKTNKLGAGAAAMSSLMPAPMDGDEKWSFSAAVGNYRSETAAAVGAFFKPQDNVIVNVRGTVGNEENMVGAGVSVALNRGNTPQVSKAQLVRKMQDMETNHKQVVAQQNSVIQTLQQEVAMMKEELKALKESK